MGKWVGEWTMEREGWNGWDGQVDVWRHDCGWGCRQVGSLDERLGAWVRACGVRWYVGGCGRAGRGERRGRWAGAPTRSWLVGWLAGWLVEWVQMQAAGCVGEWVRGGGRAWMAGWVGKIDWVGESLVHQ